MSARATDLRPAASRLGAFRVLERYGLTIAAAGLAAAGLLVVAASVGMVADSWLALVAGREIVRHGLPGRDDLAVVTLGRHWVDQQWFGQLLLYELHRITRDYFPILLVCLTAIPATAGAIALGRRASTDRATAGVALLAMLPFLTEAALPRTQSLAYPAFVVVLALLLRPQTWMTRSASIAVIVLWGNIHGSVLLGAGAVSLRFLQDARSSRGRAALLVAATWLATLCSPYALDLPAYYRSTAGSSAFGEVLSQWRPLGLSVRTIPIWLLVVAAVWLVGRSRRRLWTFEPALVLLLVILTLHSVRTAPFLALAAVALLPRLVERPAGEPSTPGLRVVLAVAAVAMSALLAVVAVTHMRFSPLTPRAAALAASGSGRIFAPLELGDWLLWSNDAVRGRVSVDARAELLTSHELRRFGALWHGGDGWKELASGYRTFVFSPTDERLLVRRLLDRSSGLRVLYRDEELVVLTRLGS